MTTTGQLETLEDKGVFQDIAQHFDDGEHAIFASRPTILPEFVKLILSAVGFFLITLMVLGIPLIIFYFVGLLTPQFLSMWYIWISLLPLLVLPLFFAIFIIGRFFKLIIGYRGSIYLVTNLDDFTRMSDAVPGHFRDMNQAIGPAQVYKGTEVSKACYHAMHNLALNQAVHHLASLSFAPFRLSGLL